MMSCLENLLMPHSMMMTLQGMKNRKMETTVRMMMASQERKGTEKLKVFLTASQK